MDRLKERVTSTESTETEQTHFIETWARWLRIKVHEFAHASNFSKQTKQELTNNFIKAIEKWKNDKDHGAKHSFDVYQGMQLLAGGDTQETPADKEMQLVAVLHDLAQFFEVRNVKTGEKLDNADARKLHADTMANYYEAFIQTLNITNVNSANLIVAIRVHDDVYNSKIHENLPYIAQLLSDGDKLFGATKEETAIEDMTPQNMVETAIERNKIGAEKQAGQGWYLLWQELSQVVRQRWRYGDRWFSDRLAAVSKDMDVHMYTEAGKKLAQERKKVFLEIAPEMYAQEFQAVVEHLQKWENLPNKPKVIATGKNHEPSEISPSNLSYLGILIQELYSLDINPGLDEKYQRDEVEARGYMIQIEFEDGTVTIDPSIARFAYNSERVFIGAEGKESFEEVIKKIVSDNFTTS